MITDSVTEMLEQIALEIREVYEERGYRVDTALEQDPAFTKSATCRSSLGRALVAQAFTTGASRVGFDLDPAAHGAKQFRANLGREIGVFRLRKAEVLADGSYKIVTSSTSTWGDADEGTLITETPYVLGYTLLSNQIGDIFFAKVIGVTGGNPGELILGRPVSLGRGNSISSDAFEPDVDDTLPGFDETEADETDSGVA